MQTLPADKANVITQWFSTRLNSRLDRLWLGSALCVAVLVALVLDFRYVPTFLIGYWYVFTLYFLKEIKAQYPFNVLPRDARKKKYIAWVIESVKVACMVAVLFLGELMIYLGMSPAVYSALVMNMLYGYIFFFRHAKTLSSVNKKTNAEIEFLRYYSASPVIMSFIIALSWLFVLYLYMKALIGDETLLGITILRIDHPTDGLAGAYLMNGLLYLFARAFLRMQ